MMHPVAAYCALHGLVLYLFVQDDKTLRYRLGDVARSKKFIGRMGNPRGARWELFHPYDTSVKTYTPTTFDAVADEAWAELPVELVNELLSHL